MILFVKVSHKCPLGYRRSVPVSPLEVKSSLVKFCDAPHGEAEMFDFIFLEKDTL